MSSFTNADLVTIAQNIADNIAEPVASGTPLHISEHLVSDNFNVCPTQVVPILRTGEGASLDIEPMRWGLMPKWANGSSPTRPLINARLETLTEKRTFRDAAENRRCIVPMNGYYEWQANPGAKRKTPYFIHDVDVVPMVVGGLWFEEADGDVFVVVTREAPTEVAEVHSRAPMALDRNACREWLAPGPMPDVPFLTAGAPRMQIRKVSHDVNNVHNNGRHLIVAVGTDELFQ